MYHSCEGLPIVEILSIRQLCKLDSVQKGGKREGGAEPQEFQAPAVTVDEVELPLHARSRASEFHCAAVLPRPARQASLRAKRGGPRMG